MNRKFVKQLARELAREFEAIVTIKGLSILPNGERIIRVQVKKGGTHETQTQSDHEHSDQT